MFIAYTVQPKFMFRCWEKDDSDEYNKRELQIKEINITGDITHEEEAEAEKIQAAI